MNQTPNYKLNQWEADDRVQRTDFNADNAKIDEALTALDVKADGKAAQTALNALISRVASLERERFYFGSYVGDGVCPRTIPLPWTPNIMLLLSWNYNSDCVVIFTQNSTSLIRGDSVSHTLVGLVKLQGSTLTLLHENFNRKDKSSSYILFR